MMTIHALPLLLREITDIRSNSKAPHWLVTEKERAFDYVKSGVPSRKQEKYKYTDFSFTNDKQYQLPQAKDNANLTEFVSATCVTEHYIVMVNGLYQPALSSALPEAITVMSLQDAIVTHPEYLKSQLLNHSESYFSELNQALFMDGLFLEVADDY